MKSVELFAGAGGLALGASSVGFKHVAVVEWNRHACETINHNRANKCALLRHWPREVQPVDVRKVEYGSVKRPVDLVAGGPPCQPFSLGGKHRGFDDARDMFPQAVRAVRELSPKAFVFENVRGLLRAKFANYVEYIRLQLSYPELVRTEGESWTDHLAALEDHHTRAGGGDLTYQVVVQPLNAADYGVPQRRERVFFVGFQSQLRTTGWHFPTATHSQDALLWSQYVTGDYWHEHGLPREEAPQRFRSRVERLKKAGVQPHRERWRTVRDALYGKDPLPDPREDTANHFKNHVFQDGARSYPGHTGSPLDEPAKALKAGDHGVPGGENMIAYEDGSVRYFTVRESARLQTFPDDYEFPGSWTENMRQLGNAVPVDLARVVMGSVRRAIESTDSVLKVVA